MSSKICRKFFIIISLIFFICCTISQGTTQAEILSSRLITSEGDFLRINKSDISVVTSLKFEGINLSEDFFNHFCEIVEGEFNKIEFINCSLEEGITFAEILDSCNTINLSIINCSIAESDLAEVDRKSVV